MVLFNNRFFYSLIVFFIGSFFLSLIAGGFVSWSFLVFLLVAFSYLFFYFFVVRYVEFIARRREESLDEHKKFSWCWHRVNSLLRKMPGGQGIDWDEGIGRRSEIRAFFDGIQYRYFRSLMGYLSKSRQLVVIVYDIDRDDIVRFYADPSPEVIYNNFYKFNPFDSSAGVGYSNPLIKGVSPRRFGRGSSRPVISNNTAGLSSGSGLFEDYDNLSMSNYEIERVADDAINVLKKKSFDDSKKGGVD